MVRRSSPTALNEGFQRYSLKRQTAGHDRLRPARHGKQPLARRAGVLALAAGLALVLGVRRRGIGGGAAVVVAFALAAAGLVIGDARRADAQECPPSTTVASTAAPTTTTAAATVASTTSTTASTTTASTTTTTSPPTTPQVFPTTPTTAATTTTVAVPDLTPSVSGPQVLILFAQNVATYTVTVTNVGSAPTDGSTMTFTVSLPFSVVGDNGALLSLASDPSTADWTVVQNEGTFGSPGNPGIPTVLTITSTPGFVLAAGASSTVTLPLELRIEDAAQFSVNVTLPAGIGGETNATNNTAAYPVTIFDLVPGG